ncbi:kelch-like protein 10 [Protopterus annectens]|uniref:kelch-like protein 10 n=1 Tax=Protopterus annectens TaxID=7888 RepID=UPI001CFBF393|nr:kelch-like protein 10 [Protopterus annectens]
MGEPLITHSLHNIHIKRKMSPTSCKIINQLRLQGKLCDAVIKVNGEEMEVHRNIMCSCSPYFRALFTSAWSKAEEKVYSISGVSADMMQLIIEYAYTRTVPVTVDNVEELLVAADRFDVLGIVTACCDFLESQLCLENCIGIKKFADCYYCPELTQKASLFILHNFEEMTKVSIEFLQLSALEFEEIIENDELNVKKEEVVFEAIIKWISYDPQDRKKCLPILLTKVRLSQMNANYFMNNVKNNDYVKDNEECKTIIRNTLKIMYELNISSYQEFRNLLIRPRIPHALLFATGGWSGSSPTNTIESYDVRADVWVDITWEIECPRAYHGVVYLKGHVYVIGGFDGENYFNSVKRFNLVERTQQDVSPMHSKRCYVSVTVLHDFIYAMGGSDGHVRLNTAERYEPEINQWTLISPMHERRSDASATTLHGKVYICGGFTGNECLLTAETYDPETNQWTLIAPMRNRRTGIGVIAYGEFVYVIGGFDGENRLSSGEVYNPLNNTWSTTSNMLTPRSNFGIAVVEDLLFVVGGYTGRTTTSSVECYNEKTKKWCAMHKIGISRSALSCCTIPGLSNVKQFVLPRHWVVTIKGSEIISLH